MSTIEREPTTADAGRGAGRHTGSPPSAGDGRRHVRNAIRRDLVFAGLALLVAVVAILPGRNGEGTSIDRKSVV